MKKLVILFLSVLSSGLLLTSCSDDDSNSSGIEGKWEFSEQGLSFGGVEQLEPYEHTPGCTKDYIELLAGGNYREFFFYNNGEGCEEDTTTGTWSRSGSNVTINSGGVSSTATIITLNETTLKVSITEEFEGVTLTAVVVFKRL